MKALLSHNDKLGLLLAFLALSATSSSSIPFLEPWGADLHNIHVYQHCAVSRSPYLIPPEICGDLFGRPLFYPPLLFHSFRWLRGLSLETAMGFWSGFMVIAIAATLLGWSRMAPVRDPDKRRWEVLVLAVLLIPQYPSAFSLERGGTDIGTLVLCTGGAWMLRRSRPLVSGVFFGLATAFKLYPSLACAVIGAALLLSWFRNGRQSPPSWLWFGLGGAIGFCACCLAFPADSLIYFRDVLPVFSKQLTGPVVQTHSIFNFVRETKLQGWIVGGLALLVWVWAASSALDRKCVGLAVAGPLALSTYFSGISFDYNLITTYPLLVLLFMRARTSGRWGLFALAICSVTIDRRLFDDAAGRLFNPYTHFALEFGALILAAIAIGINPHPKPVAELT